LLGSVTEAVSAVYRANSREERLRYAQLVGTGKEAAVTNLHVDTKETRIIPSKYIREFRDFLLECRPGY
jgi:hypothetical protein